MTQKSLRMMGVSTLALFAAGLPQGAFAAIAGGTDEPDTIIVTGTRDVGVKAQDSATPIEVLNNEMLAATGAANAFDALKDVLPSFSSAAQNADSSEMVRSARLRGMNPGEVLVLVNGKRRHNSANINADQDADTSANPADLDMIPLSAIDHVEVLLDGAAAQYGSDAVAGVINIILKGAASGTTVTAGAGITSRGDGAQGNGGFNQGLAIGGNGFLNVSVDYRHIDYMNRSNLNCLTYLNGCPSDPTTPPSGPGQVNPAGVTNGPIRNRIWGGPLSDLVVGSVNFEKPVGDLTLYAFGTAGYRSAEAYQNNREDARAPTVWPDGFFPRETLDEVDASLTAGVKGDAFGWDWDLSTTYGRDGVDLGIINTVNTGLANPPDYALHPGLGLQEPTNGKLGAEFTSQLTNNLDVRRPIQTGWWDAPLNVAAGAEIRYETYSLTAGDPVTYLDGGTQSEGGFTPTDATKSSRSVYAVYADLSTKPLPHWTVDLAWRFEDYDQLGVGSTNNYKATTRYDLLADRLAIRGTISTGFHAPTLAQSNFSATNVTPSSLSVQLPVSSPGAKQLGAPPLQPETSKDFGVGIVAQPVSKMHVTIDAYQIDLDHRIINSAPVTGAAAVAAAAANGNVIPPGATDSVYATFFNNGVSTRTRGVDVSSDYKSDFARYGQVRWMANANFNAVKITHVNPVPASFQSALAAAGDFAYPGQLPNYLNPEVVTDLTKSSPKSKISLAANWSVSDFDVTLRETRYGHVEEMQNLSSSIVAFENIYIKPAYITDIDISYFVTDALKLNIGGNNVFDKLPGKLTYAQNTSRNSMTYPVYTPWGIAGAYFYTRATYSF